MAVANSLPVALWVVPVPEFGGVARHVTDVARAGLPGFRMVVLAPQGALTASVKELGTEVIEAEFGTDAGFSTSAKTLDSVIDQLAPAVVHSHLAYADIVAAAVVNSRKLRQLLHRSLLVPQLVTTEHGIAGNDSVYHSSAAKAKIRELVHRVRLIFTDRKIAVSRSTAEQMFLKWGARGLEVIRNGVDQDAVVTAVHAHKVDSLSEGPRILSLSRLAPEKGLEVLVDAFEQVLRTYPDAHLEIAGTGGMESQLKTLVKDLGIAESVTFSGFVDPYEAMGQSDMVAQLSVWENLSYTLLDAKAAGLKVIATDVGGNSEIVSHGELVPDIYGLSQPNSAGLVAEKIIGLWQDKHKNTETVQLPTIATMVEKISQGYRKGQA